MRWSKLRTRVQERFADSVKGRVQLHSTRYREAHDQDGRSWITIDGKEIVNMPDIFTWMRQVHELQMRIRGHPECEAMEPIIFATVAQEAMLSLSIFSQCDLGTTMFNSLNTSIGEMRRSPNPIMRALAMLDRRSGKRALMSLDMSREEQLVKVMHALRCHAEGWVQDVPSESGCPL